MSTVAVQRSKTYDIVYIAVFAVIMAICSWISIPAAVPFTLQTFGVFIAVGVLGGKRGSLSVLVFILLGAIGIRRYRSPGRTYRWIHYWIFIFRSAHVGNGETSGKKISHADCFHDRRSDCVLCIWNSMVCDRLRQNEWTYWIYSSTCLLRSSVYHSGYH